MKKRIAFVMLAAMLMLACAPASADKMDILKPMWLNALESMQEQKTEKVPLERGEPKVVSGDAQLEVMRYAVYTDDEYSPEAYVYVELKNTGESTIRVNGATLNILDASDRRIGREEYAIAKPDVVLPGESIYVTEWLYDFVSDLDRVDAIEVEIERSEYSRRKIEKLPKARAYVEGDYFYAEVTNTTDEPLFGVAVLALACDESGRILDMLQDETYASVGIAPGSTMIFRESLELHAIDFPNAVCEAQGYIYED